MLNWFVPMAVAPYFWGAALVVGFWLLRTNLRKAMMKQVIC